MLLGEPPPTQADLHFRLFGFPIRVHPFFWIVALLLGLGGREADPIDVLVWVAVVFVSIVVHELGHAFLQRFFGGRPWITLYGLGGLASCNDCDRSPRSQILISLAGPLAGFLFAAIVLGGMLLTGRTFVPAGTGLPITLPGKTLYIESFSSWFLNVAIFYLFWVNIWWGLLNLLPIYPLDGGHVAREIFTLKDARSGIVQSLWLSVFTAGALAVYMLSKQLFFTTLLFGYLAYASYQALRAYQGRL